MGVSAVFAIEGRLARGATRGQIVRHTMQRAAILCVLGIIVNSFPFFELEHMRFYGVLQRIAVCYVAVSLLYLWRPRAWAMAAVLVIALAGYWVLLRWIPVPGAGLPGRDVPFMDVGQNLVSSWIGNCSPIICIATCRTTICAIRKVCSAICRRLAPR